MDITVGELLVQAVIGVSFLLPTFPISSAHPFYRGRQWKNEDPRTGRSDVRKLGRSRVNKPEQPDKVQREYITCHDQCMQVRHRYTYSLTQASHVHKQVTLHKQVGHRHRHKQVRHRHLDGHYSPSLESSPEPSL